MRKYELLHVLIFIYLFPSVVADALKKTTHRRGVITGSFSPTRSNPRKAVINLNAGCRPIEFKTNISSLLIARMIIPGQQARNMLCRALVETGHTGDICGLTGFTFTRGRRSAEGRSEQGKKTDCESDC